MKEPKIAALTSEEKEALIKQINDSALENDIKQLMLGLLSFYDDLKEQLKSSSISIKKLQEMLLGFKPDKIKKHLQTQ